MPVMHTFEVPMAPKNENFNKKNILYVFLLKFSFLGAEVPQKIIFFIEIFIFGCRGYLKSMSCGYGLYVELNFESNDSTNSNFW